jgi:hypothetical protein
MLFSGFSGMKTISCNPAANKLFLRDNGSLIADDKKPFDN